MPQKLGTNIGTKLGILGGGQLARMLALEAAPLGLEVHILSEKAMDPAAQVVKNWHKGSPLSLIDVQKFTKGLHYLTFESEFYNMLPLENLSSQSHPQIFPSPLVMKTLQDRGLQKELLVKHKIPTAPFVHVNDADDLHKSLAHFPKGFVLKKCHGGYDGNGTFYCRSHHDIEELESLLPNQFIAESFVKFKRELAVIFVRSANGDIIHLPLVESHQKQSRCDWVLGPTRHSKLPALVKKIKSLLDKIDYVGAIGFELFDTGLELLVNEIAPRVHNTGHFSQNALSESQFLLHLKAGLGLLLQKPKLIEKSFCMVNLIGESSTLEQIHIPTTISGHMHWYGKLENRPGRKMGHINYTGTQKSTLLLRQALSERKKFQL